MHPLFRGTQVLLVKPSVLLVAFVTTSWSQTRNTTVTVDDPRPVAKAVERIEKLTGIAINYEDPRFDYQADLQDVTAAVVNKQAISNRT